MLSGAKPPLRMVATARRMRQSPELPRQLADRGRETLPRREALDHRDHQVRQHLFVRRLAVGPSHHLGREIHREPANLR